MKRISLFFALLFAVCTGHTQIAEKKWLMANTWEIALNDSLGSNDLAFLKNLLAGKRIVLLGESTHGAGEYYALKSRLVQYLHRELGYEVLAMESGLADIHFQYRKIDSISALQLRNNTVFGNFMCREIMPLFNYIKQTSKDANGLLYAGFDSQNFSSSLKILEEILQYRHGASAAALIADLNKYYRTPSLMWQADKEPISRLSDTIRKAALTIKDIVISEYEEIKTRMGFNALDMKMLIRSLDNHAEALNLKWGKEDPFARRDSLMYDNLRWLIDNFYGQKKIVIWGHNSHIDRKSPGTNPNARMGNYISKAFPGSSYHIGLFAQSGEYYEWWTKSRKTFNNKAPDDLEQVISGSGRNICFLPISGKKANKANQWLFKPIYAFEPESGGRFPFTPAERFDALIWFRQVKSPSY